MVMSHFLNFSLLRWCVHVQVSPRQDKTGFSGFTIMSYLVQKSSLYWEIRSWICGKDPRCCFGAKHCEVSFTVVVYGIYKQSSWNVLVVYDFQRYKAECACTFTIVQGENCSGSNKGAQKLCNYIKRKHLPAQTAKYAHSERHCCIHVSTWVTKKQNTF